MGPIGKKKVEKMLSSTESMKQPQIAYGTPGSLWVERRNIVDGAVHLCHGIEARQLLHSQLERPKGSHLHRQAIVDKLTVLNVANVMLKRMSLDLVCEIQRQSFILQKAKGAETVPWDVT